MQCVARRRSSAVLSNDLGGLLVPRVKIKSFGYNYRLGLVVVLESLCQLQVLVLGFSGARRSRKSTYTFPPATVRKMATCLDFVMSLALKYSSTHSRYAAMSSSAGRNSCRISIVVDILVASCSILTTGVRARSGNWLTGNSTKN